MHWHHIVEQTPGNIARFGPKAIQNLDNILKVEASVHARISGFYSSKQAFTGGSTVRQWLSNQTFEQQAQVGKETLQRFGVVP